MHDQDAIAEMAQRDGECAYCGLTSAEDIRPIGTAGLCTYCTAVPPVCSAPSAHMYPCDCADGQCA